VAKADQQKDLKRSKHFESSLFISCPVCGKKGFELVQRTDVIPYFGEVLETFASCNSCKYKTSDILPLETKRAPKHQEYKISKLKDLELRVVKSKLCTIIIPEIGLRIEPGPGSEAFISNVEGLIDRIIEAVNAMDVTLPDKKESIKETVSKLKKMKDGKLKFTLIFEDENGQSAISNCKV
jgi:zinc finger protein